MPPPIREGVRKTNRSSRAQMRFIYCGLGTVFLLYLILRCWPIIYAFYLSLTDYTLGSRSGGKFIGLAHYVQLILRDRSFPLALKNTLLFAVLTSGGVLFLALSITLLMDRRRIVGISLLQCLFFLPVVVSVVPSAMIWKWMYDPQYGIFNFILSRFGASSLGWLVDSRFSLYSVVIFVIWKWLGYYMVVLWVGLKGIPAAYIEAAKVDGASDWRLIRSILLPLLRPIILFATVFATINGFTIFSEVYTMTVGAQGAPGNMVRVLAFDIYERAFQYFRVGQANAEAVILFFIVLALTLIQGRLVRKGELY